MTITRREFLGRAATVAAAAAAGPLLRASPALATGTCILGVWSLNVGLLQSQLGRMFRGIRWNQSMQTPIPAKSELEWFRQGHWMIYRAVNAQTRSGGRKPVCISWRGIANGAHDAYFESAAHSLRASAFTRTHPYFFSFAHEQIVNNSSQCGNKACGSPADYIAAYRHVRNIFNNAGASVSHGGNVRFVWAPVASQFRVPDHPYGAPTVDPGPDYYDYVGVDAYNRRAGRDLEFSTASSMLGAAHNYAKMRGKQMIIAEYGIADGPSSTDNHQKAAFLLNTASQIASWGASGAGSVYSWMLTDLGTYRIDSSPASLAAMRKIVELKLFG